MRFGEGWVEKSKGSILYNDTLSSRITHIGIFTPRNSLPATVVFTEDNVYYLNDATSTLSSLITDTYTVTGSIFISDCTVEDKYVYTNYNNDIHVWDGVGDKAYPLYGTYEPHNWTAETAYVLGDVVKPSETNYNGFVYKCTTAGTSGATEPTWSTGNTGFQDGTAYWTLCGGLEIEGNSARSLRARNIAYYKGFVFLANTEENGTAYPQRLRWSQYNNPYIWHNNEDGSGLAGYVDCTDGTDPIVTIKVFGEYLIVYKQNSIQIISYTGNSETTFERTIVSTDVGLLAPRGILTTPNLHVFVGYDNIYTFNGNDTTAIGDPIRAEFFKTLNPSKRDRILAFYDKQYPEMIFAYHSVSNTTEQYDKALTYNPKTKAWGFRDFKYSAIGEIVLSNDLPIDSITMTIDEMIDGIDDALNQQNASQILLGDANGNLLFQKGYTEFSSNLDGYVITKSHHMEAPESLKRLLRIQFHIETQGDYPLTVQVGYGNNAESIMNWTSEYSLSLNNPNPPWIDVDITARYFAIKFGTKYNAQPFKVLGYTLYYQTRTVQ